jgi:hypothetical protein
MLTAYDAPNPLLYGACSALVGVVFVATGALKMLRPRSFIRQVREYGILPRHRLAHQAPLLFIAFECALGVSLLLNPGPPVLGVTLALLAGLVFLTLWGALTGRVEDCGCYGDLILLRPWQSAALDLVYLLLTGTAWAVRPAGAGKFTPWGLAVASLVAAGSFLLASRNLQRPLDTSPLKQDKMWRAGWLKESPRDLKSGNHLVVFLGRECPYCKRWVPLLNVIEVQQDFPGVMGVLALSAPEVDEFKSEHLIHFPIARMQRTLFSILAEAVPTAVLIEDGKIREKWTGKMPEPYMERVRGFYEAIGAETPTRKVFAG